MPPTSKSRLRLRPCWVEGAGTKLHLTLNRKTALCGQVVPLKSYAHDEDRYGRWFNDDGCRTCAKEARKLERGCTRCPAILFKPEQVSRGLCAACYRKKRKPKLRPSQVAAQREYAKQQKAAEKQARAPWTTWPAAEPRLIDDWRHRPLVTSMMAFDRLLELQRLGDQLDQHLMAAPSPVPATITAGRQQTQYGQRYTFHDPTLGLLGEMQLVLLGDGLTVRVLTAGHPDDPMSATRTAALQAIMDALTPRFAALEALPPPPRQGLIPSITARQAYHDPERLRTREYPCTRCQAVVAQLILADGVLEDAIRVVVATRPVSTIPTWVVGLATGEGDDAARLCPVVQVLPTRTDAVMLTAPAFESQMRRLRLAHCRVPRTKRVAKDAPDSI